METSTIMIRRWKKKAVISNAQGIWFSLCEPRPWQIWEVAGLSGFFLDSSPGGAGYNDGLLVASKCVGAATEMGLQT